jgi:hypothetical protein
MLSNPSNDSARPNRPWKAPAFICAARSVCNTSESDPFPLLTIFVTTSLDDYLAGFPWHLHGIETITMSGLAPSNTLTAWQ